MVTIIIFQSTLPRRERLNDEEVTRSKVMEFQSTLPRRERRSGSVTVWDSSDFNPRSREGSEPE